LEKIKKNVSQCPTKEILLIFRKKDDLKDKGRGGISLDQGKRPVSK